MAIPTIVDVRDNGPFIRRLDGTVRPACYRPLSTTSTSWSATGSSSLCWVQRFGQLLPPDHPGRPEPARRRPARSRDVGATAGLLRPEG
jgi:hypothetical protein